MKALKAKIFLFILIFVVLLIVTYFAGLWRTNEAYKKITLRGNLTLTKEDILGYANIKSDSVNVSEINPVFILDRISKHPEIKKAFISEEPPSEIIIDIVEKNPIAIVNTDNELLLIDEEQELFSFSHFEKIMDLPVINGIYSISPKSKNKNKNLELALNLINALYMNGKYVFSMVSEISMADSTRLIVYSNDNSVPFFFPRYDKVNNEMAKLLYSEKLILFSKVIESNMLTHNEKLPEYVDLRFSNQVVAKYN